MSGLVIMIFEKITKNKKFFYWLYDTIFSKENYPYADSEFLKILKSYYYNIEDYNPDINGYVFFFLVPPHLSAKEYEKFIGTPNNPTDFFRYFNTAVPFLATNVQLPSTQVKVSEYDLRTGGIPLADEVENSNQLSVTYLDTKELHVYSLHSIWIEYINEVSKGIVKPGNYISGSSTVDKTSLGTDSDYIADGNMDYITCAYVIKFTPDLKISYFARLTGIFPTTRNPQDIVGDRTNKSITLVNIPYVVAFYHEFTYPELIGNNITIENPQLNIFLKDFKNKLYNYIRTL